MYSDETKAKFIQLRSQGKTIRAAARELSVSVSAAAQWNKTYSAQVVRAYRDEISEALDSFAASRIQRTRVLAASFKQIERFLHGSEAAIRNNIKAYDLLMRIDKHLNRELLPSDSDKGPAIELDNDTVKDARSFHWTPFEPSEEKPPVEKKKKPESVNQPGPKSAPATDTPASTGVAVL